MRPARLIEPRLRPRSTGIRRGSRRRAVLSAKHQKAERTSKARLFRLSAIGHCLERSSSNSERRRSPTRGPSCSSISPTCRSSTTYPTPRTSGRRAPHTVGLESVPSHICSDRSSSRNMAGRLVSGIQVDGNDGRAQVGSHPGRVVDQRRLAHASRIVEKGDDGPRRGRLRTGVTTRLSSTRNSAGGLPLSRSAFRAGAMPTPNFCT